MYTYAQYRDRVFTEHGAVTLSKIRQVTKRLLETSDEVNIISIIATIDDNLYDMIACVDYMVETGELKETTAAGLSAHRRSYVAGSIKIQGVD